MIRIDRLGKHLKRLWACERGASAPLVGACAIVLVGAVGVALDVGRGQVAQSKLQASLDAAGLAAGAMVGQNLSETLLKPEAEKYLNANFNGKTVEATITEFDLDLSDDNSIVTLQAKAKLPTTLMRIFGRKEMQVAARSEITREMTGLEVALVLDVTGSMDDPVGGTGPGSTDKKIDALRTAGTDLVNILFGSNSEVDDLWVGVVPFSQSVNIGTNHADWMEDLENYTDKIYCSGSKTSGWPRCPDDAYTISSANVSTRTDPITRVNRYMDADPSDWYFKDPDTGERHGWGGCVLERWESGRDVTDDPSDVERWKTYFVPDGSGNNWRDSDGDYNVYLDHDGDQYYEERSANKGCPEEAITNFTNKKADLLAAINGLAPYPRGGTHIAPGAVWGWRLLSPEWRGEWGGDMDANDLPLDYDEPLSQKAVILMTDGMNTAYTNIYTAYGWLSNGSLGTTSDVNTAEATLNAKTKTICDGMKENGILIYTIVFGNGSNSIAKDLMKNCASEVDFYFFSPSTDALKAAFKTIGDSLSKLRVSK